MNQEQGFGSDAVFKFLSGTHNVYSPLTFRNVHNVSLLGTQSRSESDLPVLITQSFSCFRCDGRDHSACDQCSVVYSQNVTHTTIEGIKIIITAQCSSPFAGLDGLSLRYCNSFAIYNVRIVNYDQWTEAKGISIGRSNNISINYTAVQSADGGMFFYYSSHVTLKNSITQCNFPNRYIGWGIEINNVNDTAIVNSVVWDYTDKALTLLYTRNITITATTVSSNYISNSL